MATVRTVTVKSSSGDYTSLSNAEAGEQGNLPTLDRQLNIECYSMEDTTAVTIDGWTTDATRYISIYAPAGDRHDGKWNTAKYYMSCSSNAITISESDVTIDGLQITITGASATYGIIYNSGGATNVKISNCIIWNQATASTLCGIHHSYNDSSGTLTVWNCIIYGFSTTNSRGAEANTFRAMVLYNCTFSGCAYGVSRYYGTLTLKNCIFSNCTNDASGTIADTYCATSNDNTKGLTAAGTGNRFSQTFTFVGASDFHLQSSDAGARDYGVSDPGSGLFSNDIDGSTRSGTWDIGADEYVAAASGNPWYYYAQQQ